MGYAFIPVKFCIIGQLNFDVRHTCKKIRTK